MARGRLSAVGVEGKETAVDSAVDWVREEALMEEELMELPTYIIQEVWVITLLSRLH